MLRNLAESERPARPGAFYDLAQLAPFWEQRHAKVDLNVGDRLLILPADPRRIVLAFNAHSLGDNALFVQADGPVPQDTITGQWGGWDVYQNGPALTFRYSDWGDLPARGWWIESVAYGGPLWIFESLWIPRR